MINEDLNINEIDKIYVFVSDSPNGGIIAEQLPINGKLTWMPFVSSGGDALDKMYVRAIHMNKVTGEKIKVLKFTNKEEIGIIG